MAWWVLTACLVAIVFVQAAMIQSLRSERDQLSRTLAWKDAKLVRDGEKVYVRKGRV